MTTDSIDSLLPSRFPDQGASTSTPLLPLAQPTRLQDLRGLVLRYRGPTGTTDVIMDLPDLPLDPDWTVADWTAHLDTMGYGPRPGDSDLVHVVYDARDDLNRAIQQLDLYEARRLLLALPGRRSNGLNGLLIQALSLPLDRLTPIEPMDLGQRMAVQEALVALLLALGVRPDDDTWRYAMHGGNPRLFFRLLEVEPTALVLPVSLDQSLRVDLMLSELCVHNRWDSGRWILDRLLQAGGTVNPDGPPEHGQRPWLTVACESRNHARVEDLILRGADVNRPRPDGAPPLKTAFTANDPDLVMALLHAGADLHARIPAKGWTVLEDAVLRGALTSVQRLLNDGVDPFEVPTRPPGGQTAPAEGSARPDPTVLQRLLELRVHLPIVGLPSAVDPADGLSDGAQACLVLLETHALTHTMDALPPAAPGVPRRRL